jgi:hypothetical protein
MAKLRRSRDPLRVVFAGPSLYGTDIDRAGIDLRRPAQQGDVEQAVADGAVAVGLVDGHYQQVGAVWHKEILLALAAGVTVFGSSSMGALRAAECEGFGMIPIGSIASSYCSGTLFDDADVAIVNGPAELGYPPLTEPMVTVAATLDHLLVSAALGREECRMILDAAKSIYFADRTVEAIFDKATSGTRAAQLVDLYRQYRVDPKASDAIKLVEAVRRVGRRNQRPTTWRLAQSPFWTGRTVRSGSMTLA